MKQTNKLFQKEISLKFPLSVIDRKTDACGFPVWTGRRVFSKGRVLCFQKPGLDRAV